MPGPTADITVPLPDGRALRAAIAVPPDPARHTDAARSTDAGRGTTGPTRGADAGRTTGPARGADAGRTTGPARGTDAGRSTDPGHTTDPGRTTEPSRAIPPSRTTDPTPGAEPAPATDPGRTTEPSATTDARHPGVLLVHESWGLTGDMRAMAARFAAHGYVALAPDLYSAGSRPACLTQILVDYVRGRGRGPTLDLLDGARAALAARDDVDPDRLAVFGVCMGGGFALAFAVGRGLRAASVNYGKVPRDRRALEGVCPVVAGYGGRDLVYRHNADRLERHLAALGVPHDVHTYETAGHAYLSREEPFVTRLPSPMAVGYDETAAEDTWRRILAFFGEHV